MVSSQHALDYAVPALIGMATPFCILPATSVCGMVPLIRRAFGLRCLILETMFLDRCHLMPIGLTTPHDA